MSGFSTELKCWKRSAKAMMFSSCSNGSRDFTKYGISIRNSSTCKQLWCVIGLEEIFNLLNYKTIFQIKNAKGLRLIFFFLRFCSYGMVNRSQIPGSIRHKKAFLYNALPISATDFNQKDLHYQIKSLKILILAPKLH